MLVRPLKSHDKLAITRAGTIAGENAVDRRAKPDLQFLTLRKDEGICVGLGGEIHDEKLLGANQGCARSFRGKNRDLSAFGPGRNQV
jgi:hypothetical protein